MLCASTDAEAKIELSFLKKQIGSFLCMGNKF